MPLVYDKEKEKTPKAAPDGAHDDLGVSPEDRASEVADLEKQFAAPDVSADNEEEGFFKPEKGGKQGGGAFSRARSALGSKKKGLLIGGGGALGIGGVMIAMFSHLAFFQLDSLLKNTDLKARAQLNASLDARNDKLVKAYIKVRMTDPDNDTSGKSPLLFRANKVDTNNPIRDWYETMRASKFEQDLFEKQGIKFTSIIGTDGKVRVGQIDISGEKPIPYKLSDTTMSQQQVYDLLDGVAGGGDISALNRLGTDLDKFVDVTVFENHKAARQAIKAAVNDNTAFYQVFARRHIRKDIQNMTGVRNWSLFETQRDKLAQKKIDIRNNLVNRIVDRYYGNNPGPTNMLKCLFSDGKCSSNSDPESEDNKSTNVATGSDVEGNDTSNVDATTDKDGKVVPTDISSETKGISGEISDAVDKTITTSSEDAGKGLSTKAAATLETSSVGKKIIYALVAKILNKDIGDVIESAASFESPTQVWTWLKRFAKIDGLLCGKKSADCKVGSGALVKIIKNTRRAQLEGIYATYQIAASQMHSGKVTNEEVSQFMDMTKGFGNSEGWQMLSQSASTGTAGATGTQAEQNLSKGQYCKLDPSQRTADMFAWLCDNEKPSNGGTAQSIAEGYMNTVGGGLHKMAYAVDEIESSIVGKAANWASNVVSSLLGKITEPIINAVMENTGLQNTITTIATTGMMKLITWLGGGPMYDGSQPGNVAANMVIAGGVATAQDSTRSSGGIAATPQSSAYSSHLADQYIAQNTSQESLYDRYISLDNVNSLASTALMNIHPSEGVLGVFNTLGDLFKTFPRYLGDILTGRMFAHADNGDSSSQLANWAGVQQYNIPQACIDLDPLDPNYLDKATNAASIASQANIANSSSLSGSALGIDTLRDGDKFWSAVYGVIGADNEAAANKIYDCALLDARVEGSLGAVYGYTSDGGLGD